MTAFTYVPRTRPDSKLADFLGKVVSFLAIGNEFDHKSTGADGKPFTTRAVLAKVLAFDTTTGKAVRASTILFPGGIRQDAIAAGGWTEPGVLRKVAHTDAAKASQGHTVWVVEPITAAGLATVSDAFTALMES
jgi:hypothetical protein